MQIVDANIILRYLLGDVAEMRIKSVAVLDGDAPVLILDEVLEEVVYVLEGVYKIKRNIISDTLTQFLSKPQIITRSYNVLVTALKFFAKYNIDFVDSVLLAYSIDDSNLIISFDKKLLSLIKNIKKKS